MIRIFPKRKKDWEDLEIARIILEYIQAVAWPAVAIFAIIIFREPLVEILRRLRGAGLPGGVSLDFGKEVRDAEALSKVVEKEPQKYPTPSTPMLPLTQANERMLSVGLQPSPSGLEMSRYSELAQQDPNLALAGLRMEVEILLRNIAKINEIDINKNVSTRLLLGKIYEKNAITSNQYLLIKKIITLCNAAVHGTRISREEAEAVIDVARVLAEDYLAWLSWGFGNGWAPKQKET